MEGRASTAGSGQLKLVPLSEFAPRSENRERTASAAALAAGIDTVRMLFNTVLAKKVARNLSKTAQKNRTTRDTTL
jgi:hypothetical protein